MARGTANIRTENAIRPLAENLFDLSGPNRAANTRVAEAALLRANPSLAAAAGFTPGRVVVVPEISVPPTARVDPPAADLDGLLRETATRLRQAGNAASDGFAASAKEVQQMLRLLSDDKFVAELTKNAPEQGAKLVAEARATVAARTQAEKASRRDMDILLDEAADEIMRLRKLASGKS